MVGGGGGGCSDDRSQASPTRLQPAPLAAATALSLQPADRRRDTNPFPSRSVLAGIRRRVAERVSSSERVAFCNTFMRVYCLMLTLQARV